MEAKSKGIGSEEKMTYKELKKRERKTLKLKNRKGLSPVIATVILVAVAITVAVSVAYWMSSIAGQYTTFEKVEIPAHYSKYIVALTVPADPGEVIATQESLEVDRKTIFEGNLEYTPIDPKSIIITATVSTIDPKTVTITDVDGFLSDKHDTSATVNGTIDYVTGAWTLTWLGTNLGPLVSSDITAVYSSLEGWKEYVELRNSGSKDATITNMFLNNVPLYDYPGMSLIISTSDGTEYALTDLSQLTISVTKGSWVKIILWIPEYTEGCSPNTTIDLKIVTAAGNQYPILEVLV